MRATLLIIIIIGIVLLLAVTNPDRDDFAEWAAKEYQNNGGWLGALIGEVSASLIRLSTQRDNYIFFSIFTVEEQTRVLGIMQQFYILDRADLY